MILADHPAVAAQLAESAERCRGLGGEVSVTAFDVTDERATDAAVRESGRIGGLSTAPGSRAPSRRSTRYPLDDARRVLDVDVLGLFAVLAAVAAT